MIKQLPHGGSTRGSKPMRHAMVLALIVGMTGPALSQQYCVDDAQRVFQLEGYVCTPAGKAVCKQNGQFVLQGHCSPQDPARAAGILGVMRNGTLVRPNPNERIPLDPPVQQNRVEFGAPSTGGQAAANRGFLPDSGSPSAIGLGVPARTGSICRTPNGMCEVPRAGPCECLTRDGRHVLPGTASAN